MTWNIMMMNIGIQIKMGINIPIEKIEEYQDDHLWDDIKEHIKMILWETGLYSWTDLESSESEYDRESMNNSEDEIISDYESEDTMEFFRDEEMAEINEIVDEIERREEIIDISNISI